MKPLARPATHGQCRHCRAWVDWDDDQCPVCGIAAPHSWLRKVPARLGGWRGVGGAAGMVAGILGGIGLGAALGDVWHGAQQPLTISALLAISALGGVAGAVIDRRKGAGPGALAGLTLGILAGGALVRWLAAGVVAMVGAALMVVAGNSLGKELGARFGERVADLRRPRNLLECRDGAVSRQQELEGELAKMAKLEAQLRAEVPSSRAAAVLQALAAASEATWRQVDRHRIDGWRMSLAIWQNRLAPALAGWRDADESTAMAELERVKLARDELDQLKGAWLSHPSADSDRGQRVLAHAERLADAAEHLCHALLMRQAVVLAERSPGAGEAFGLQTVPERGSLEDDPALDILRIRLAVDEAQTAVEARDEALRLRAEQAAIAEVESLLGRPNRRRA